MDPIGAVSFHDSDLVFLEKREQHSARVFRTGFEYRMERYVWSREISDATWSTGLKAMDQPEWKMSPTTVEGSEMGDMVETAIVDQWGKRSRERWYRH